MIKFTCQTPSVRSGKIINGLDLVHDVEDPYLKTFGVELSREMVTVPARILPAPVLSYHPLSKEANITPVQGTWNLKDRMVAQGVTLDYWVVLVFASKKEFPVKMVNEFVGLFTSTSQECGMHSSPNPPVVYADTSDVMKSVIDAYMTCGNKFSARPQLIFCILPNTNVQVYSEIKRVGDTVIGVVTQCIQGKNCHNPKRQYCANVVLKINAKLGGMNSFLSSSELEFVAKEPTLICGADLTSDKIACLVTNVDSSCARYISVLRHQEHQEYISTLGDMMVEQLRNFYQESGLKPEVIVFYRYRQNCNYEAERDQLLEAFETIEPGYSPRLTFILVDQSHHSKFFPKSNDADVGGNVFPGTVIDSRVTSGLEFFLFSHPGLQGTSRPTHYEIVHDENSLDPDTIQSMTFRLCFLYCRATRSVSVVPPLYYCKLSGARARFHLKDTELLPVSPLLEKKMYFM